MSTSGQKIPGYSGHIPFKQDLIGLTTGETNRQAGEGYHKFHMSGQNFNNGYGLSSTGKIVMEQPSMEGKMRSTMVDGSREGAERARMVGNASKTSTTWVNGPTHEIRNQCVPGYTGFISGIKSENLFSKSYAENTAKSFKSKITRGADLPPQKRY